MDGPSDTPREALVIPLVIPRDPLLGGPCLVVPTRVIDDTLPSDEILNSFQRPGSHLNAKAYATRIDTHTLPSVQESRSGSSSRMLEA